MIRVFISFASSNGHFAEGLHEALTKRGATVFQFEKSARAGKSAWEQVYDNIDDADYFVCLLSRETIKSRPVQKEIGYADHRNTNNDGRPEIVPVLLESVEPTKWPKPLRPLTPLDLTDCTDPSHYASGISRIVDALDIEEVAGASIPGNSQDMADREGAALRLLALRMRGVPETSEVPSTVQWAIEVENVGTRDLHAVRVTLDGQEIEEPFFIAVGETRQFTKSSRYKAPGAKTRRLRAFVISEKGATLLAEQDAHIDVTSPPARAAEAAALAPSDAKIRERLETGYSDFPWGAVGYPLIVLIFGAAVTWGAVGLMPFVLEGVRSFFFSPPYEWLPTFPVDILVWIGAAGWFHWATGLLAVGVIVVASWQIAEEEIPIDVIDYVKIAFQSAFVAILVSGLWAVLHVEGYPQGDLLVMVGGAVVLSSVVVAVYAIADEI